MREKNKKIPHSHVSGNSLSFITFPEQSLIKGRVVDARRENQFDGRISQMCRSTDSARYASNERVDRDWRDALPRVVANNAHAVIAISRDVVRDQNEAAPNANNDIGTSPRGTIR